MTRQTLKTQALVAAPVKGAGQGNGRLQTWPPVQVEVLERPGKQRMTSASDKEQGRLAQRAELTPVMAGKRNFLALAQPPLGWLLCSPPRTFARAPHNWAHKGGVTQSVRAF